MSGKLEKITSLGWSGALLGGFAGAIIYCGFTFTSMLFFPGPFSPFEYHLSKLGNSSANPQGAIFYNIGIILTGLCLFFSYIGLYSSYTRSQPSKLMGAALLIGCFNTLALSMSGVFSEDIYALHYIWSLLIFISLIPVLVLVNIFLIFRPGSDRIISVYGFIVVAIDSFFLFRVLTIGTSGGSIFEWITVFTWIAWALLVTGNILRRVLSSS